ncbi:hypothetical protein CTI12_AA542690 [Artemisia annua]|uniref:Transposase, Ptta/En/Spm n=1 Tax=Artemisia annua TaxID=35608 RepID=A0A2U1KWM3_ARTAN|nr:hypothetical protein CTI12_AA542690 [Artemisia annua]
MGRKKDHDAKLEKKFDDGGKQKLSIDFDYRDRRTAKPVGDNSGDFTRLIANEIQRSVPFHYETWDDVDDKYKTTLWPRIHTFFNMKPHLLGQNVKLFEEGMQAQFRSAYRNRNNKFKKEHFVDMGGYDHPEEIRNFPPGNMSLSDWHEFCNHVTSNKHMKRSQANKANRGKQLYTSNHGSKSYAQSRHEEWANGKGAYPDLIKQFKNKHVYKKGDKAGQWKSEAAEAKYLSHSF